MLESRETFSTFVISPSLCSLWVCSVVCDSATHGLSHQAPLVMGFPRQEYWRELPFPSPGDLPDPGIEHASLMSPALAGGFFATSATWEFIYMCI